MRIEGWGLTHHWRERMALKGWPWRVCMLRKLNALLFPDALSYFDHFRDELPKAFFELMCVCVFFFLSVFHYNSDQSEDMWTVKETA